MQANNIKSSISLTGVNHTYSTVYSFVNQDGAEAGFKLQLGVDEVQKHLGMSRELNVEIQTNYRTEETKETHANKDNDSRKGNDNISNDHNRKTVVFF